MLLGLGRDPPVLSVRLARHPSTLALDDLPRILEGLGRCGLGQSSFAEVKLGPELLFPESGRVRADHLRPLCSLFEVVGSGGHLL